MAVKVALGQLDIFEIVAYRFIAAAALLLVITWLWKGGKAFKVERQDLPWLAIGTPGNDGIWQRMAQVLVNIIDLQEVNYCYRDSGPGESAWTTDNHCGYEHCDIAGYRGGWFCSRCRGHNV